MNNKDLNFKEIKPQIHTKFFPQIYEGIYHSNTINKPPAEVYAFCQKKVKLQEALVDLPEKTKNFLDLEFVSANAVDDGYQVQWKNNKTADKQGRLVFNLTPSPKGRGTVLIANAIFADYTMDDEEPSDLINIFLKRIKAFSETGQLATTKGQPNGKDEKEINETLKH